ncbi:hypothetical protein L0Y69_02235 [bacterium]|nr:hypothetical protein [bacterium]
MEKLLETNIEPPPSNAENTEKFVLGLDSEEIATAPLEGQDIEAIGQYFAGTAYDAYEEKYGDEHWKEEAKNQQMAEKGGLLDRFFEKHGALIRRVAFLGTITSAAAGMQGCMAIYGGGIKGGDFRHETVDQYADIEHRYQDQEDSIRYDPNISPEHKRIELQRIRKHESIEKRDIRERERYINKIVRDLYRTRSHRGR